MFGFHFNRNHLIQSSVVSLVAITSPVLLLTSGCTQKSENEVRLEIKNIQSASSSGVYKVTGTTNLPESSQVAIAAVRYLHPLEAEQNIGLSPDPNTNRSILDRQIVEVKKGQWEADLNLWQVSPDGSYRETWQANQSHSKLAPENDVTFNVTFDPGSQSQKSEKPTVTVEKSEAVQPQFQELEGKLLRFTNEGDKYVQASQSLLIPLPSGKTAPPRSQPEDANNGWGNRYEIPPQTLASGSAPLPVTKSRQTNARLSAAEFLR
jgi:hypothetical protein